VPQTPPIPHPPPSSSGLTRGSIPLRLQSAQSCLGHRYGMDYPVKPGNDGRVCGKGPAIPVALITFLASQSRSSFQAKQNRPETVRSGFLFFNFPKQAFRENHTRRSTIIFLISAMALAELRPFYQVDCKPKFLSTRC